MCCDHPLSAPPENGHCRSPGRPSVLCQSLACGVQRKMQSSTQRMVAELREEWVFLSPVSFHLVCLCIRSHGSGIESIDVVEQIVGDDVAGVGLFLDDALCQQPFHVALVVRLDIVAPALSV